MVDRRAIRAAAALLLILPLAACMRPTGDFGRSADSVLHDEFMPKAGTWRAQAAGEPVSTFNMADQENEMRDRVWRYLEAPHARDWMFDTVAELKRTRLMSQAKHKGDEAAYYKWLTSERFASSRVRYNRIKEDAIADTATMEPTFISICAVLELDRQRQVAADDLQIDAARLQEVRDRRAENRLVIDWFVWAVNYRYDSYGYALDHLLVETPHEEAVAADASLSELAIWVDAANRGDFCSGYGHGGGKGGVTIQSRYARQAPGEGEYYK